MDSTPIARRLWPELRGCFGCDPDHPRGVRLEGRVEGDAIVADWHPGDGFESWPGVVHGGVLATLLDEVTGWAAKYAFVERDGADERPIVTAEMNVRYRAPALSNRPIRVEARVAEHGDEHILVDGLLATGGTTLATASARYVRLRERPAWMS